MENCMAGLTSLPLRSYSDSSRGHPGQRSMNHPPGTQLSQDGRLASQRHFLGPLAVHPQSKGTGGGKGQIDQFNFESFLSLEVAKEQTVVRFGTRHDPFYRPNLNNARQKSKGFVFNKIYSAVYNIRPNSR
jgi:hypothetical protein